MPIRVAVIGGRGFVGGELIRLLLHHPDVEILWVTSSTHPEEKLEYSHPPLRGSNLRYTHPESVGRCDVAFLCAGHGTSAENILALEKKAEKIIDLGADFRLQNRVAMKRYYGWSRPDGFADAFTLGLPELNRSAIVDANRVAVPGCMATSAILMLAPIAATGKVSSVVVDARTGSSGSGSNTDYNSHAVRANVLRIFAPLSHRHEAEISQALGLDVSMTVTAVPQVRGVQTICRVKAPGLTDKELRSSYADMYRVEPFVRFLGSTRGGFKYPDPKVMLGSNFCDVNFATDGSDFLLVGALDNLMKGAAGNAVQCFNLMHGLDETLGLTFPGIHPV